MFFNFRLLNGLDCQAYSLLSHVQKTRSFIINVTLFSSKFVCGPLPKFVFNAIFNDEGSACVTAVSVHSKVTFSAYKTIPQILSFMLRMCKETSSLPGEKKELVSRSLRASLRSLETMNINVVKLSLNGNTPCVGGLLLCGRECRQEIHPSIS